MISGVVASGYWIDGATEVDVLLKRCLLSTLWVTCLYCSVQMRDSVLFRPHPAFWRLMHGAAVWYLMLISILAVLPSSWAKEGVRSAFPEIRQTALEEKETMGAWHLQCELNAETLYRQVTSVWFIAHVVGWWGKMLVFRNWHMCLIFSTFFEFTELTLQFSIPEFQECWWDSLLLDWGCANIIGMTMGSLSLYFLTCRSYSWKPWKDVHGTCPFMKRFIQQFFPYSWSQYRWNESQSLQHYCLQSLCIVFALFMEINSFLMIQTLGIPPAHPVNSVRLVILSMNALPAVHEWHLYVTGQETRIGYNCWTISIIILLEIYVYFKYASMEGLWNRARGEIPVWVILPWLSFALLQCLYMVLHWRLEREATRKDWRIPGWLRFLRFSSLLPLLGLMRYYAT